MDTEHNLCCMILLIITFTTVSVSSLPSGGRDEVLHSTGRSILQEHTECPVNIEKLNYTILKSQCKQPWQAQPCCDALRDIACPFSDQLNNLSNGCAVILFHYTSLFNYPDGLFENICPKGQPCPITTTSANQRLSNPSHKLMIFTEIFLLLLLGVLGL